MSRSFLPLVLLLVACPAPIEPETVYIDPENTSGTTVSFEVSSTTVEESVGSTEIVVQVSAELGSDLAVPFTTGGGTVDFDCAVAEHEVVILAGEVSASIVVSVFDDPFAEVDEAYFITLTDTSEFAVGAIATHTLWITHNDKGTAASEFDVPPDDLNDELVDANLLGEVDFESLVVTGDTSNPDPDSFVAYTRRGTHVQFVLRSESIFAEMEVVRFNNAQVLQATSNGIGEIGPIQFAVPIHQDFFLQVRCENQAVPYELEVMTLENPLVALSEDEPNDITASARYLGDVDSGFDAFAKGHVDGSDVDVFRLDNSGNQDADIAVYPHSQDAVLAMTIIGIDGGTSEVIASGPGEPVTLDSPLSIPGSESHFFIEVRSEGVASPYTLLVWELVP